MCKLYLLNLAKKNLRFNFAIISHTNVDKIDKAKNKSYVDFISPHYMVLIDKKVYDLNVDIYDNIVDRISKNKNNIHTMHIIVNNNKLYIQINDYNNILLCDTIINDMNDTHYTLVDIIL